MKSKNPYCSAEKADEAFKALSIILKQTGDAVLAFGIEMEKCKKIEDVGVAWGLNNELSKEDEK